MSQPTGQMIQVPNTLRLKVGGRFGAIDPLAIAKAEAALKSLSSNFAEWLNDELVKLEAARARIKADGWTSETAEGLYMRAHDLKGLGTTYEFPLITRIAGNLCKMIDDPATRLNAPLYIIDAHIDSIKACVRENIKTDENPVGKAMAEELERKVRELQA
jgi:hypothetical protein